MEKFRVSRGLSDFGKRVLVGAALLGLAFYSQIYTWLSSDFNRNQLVIKIQHFLIFYIIPLFYLFLFFLLFRFFLRAFSRFAQAHPKKAKELREKYRSALRRKFIFFLIVRDVLKRRREKYGKDRKTS